MSEKKQILTVMGQINQEQIDALIATFQEERRRFSELAPKHWPDLAVLFQKHWGEWASLLASFLGREVMKEPVEAHLQSTIPPEKEQHVVTRFNHLRDWDESLQQSGAPVALLPAHPSVNFDERVFLNLLSQSLSLSQDEKRRILKALDRLSQLQIDELIKILEEERRKFSELAPQHLPQLASLDQKCWDEWTALLSELTGLETAESDPRENDVNMANIEYSELDDPAPPELTANPFASQPSCDGFLPAGVDIRSIIPAHPKTFFSERRFLQLLSGSISLTQEEKRRIVEAAPKLSQYQFDELTKILLTERRTFLGLDPKDWPELQTLCTEHWDYWPDLVYDLLPQLPKLAAAMEGDIAGLNGELWHWTSSLDSEHGMRWIAGGPEMKAPGFTDRFPLRQEPIAQAEEKRSKIRGFRGAVPIFSNDDLRDLVPIKMTGPGEGPEGGTT